MNRLSRVGGMASLRPTVIKLAQDRPDLRPHLLEALKVAAWENLPKGWTDESVKKMWDTLTDGVKHKVTKCMKEMEGKVSDTGAFCGSLADKVDPGWRSRSASTPVLDATLLRRALIRVAHQHDDLRPLLLPMITRRA